eukprot:scaffold60160_cov54-Phaeocystis_antarctica.AAC.3
MPVDERGGGHVADQLGQPEGGHDVAVLRLSLAQAEVVDEHGHDGQHDAHRGAREEHARRDRPDARVAPLRQRRDLLLKLAKREQARRRRGEQVRRGRLHLRLEHARADAALLLVQQHRADLLARELAGAAGLELAEEACGEAGVQVLGVGGGEGEEWRRATAARAAAVGGGRLRSRAKLAGAGALRCSWPVGARQFVVATRTVGEGTRGSSSQRRQQPPGGRGRHTGHCSAAGPGALAEMSR